MITWLTTWLKKNHWLHSWSKWQEKAYSITYFGKDTPTVGTQLFQDRQCSVCGKKESERI